MGVLSSKQRSKLPGAVFGLPAQRKYPMPDAEHAANAKARATQQLARGNLSRTQAAAIRLQANRILHGGK